jgi:hypothetical protein
MQAAGHFATRYLPGSEIFLCVGMEHGVQQECGFARSHRKVRQTGREIVNMASVGVIRAQLSSIRAQLLQMRVFAAGRAEEDDKADAEEAQLERVAGQLQLILRDLKTSSHLVQLQLENIRKVPFDNRWSAKQRADQKSRDIADLYAEAKALAELVKDLLRRNGLISPMQAGKEAIELIKDLEEHLPIHTRASIEIPTNYPVFTRPAHESPHVESLVPLVTLAYLMIKYWKERRSSKK